MQDEGIVYLEILNVIIAETDLKAAPIHDGAEFISSALRATAEAHPRVRQVVQQDIAYTLNCQDDDLSFLWKAQAHGHEVLECHIPDFRNSLVPANESYPYGVLAAE